MRVGITCFSLSLLIVIGCRIHMVSMVLHLVYVLSGLFEELVGFYLGSSP